VEVEPLKNLFLSANVIYASGTYLRGGRRQPPAKLDDYTTLNLGVRWVPIKYLEVWGRVDNVTNAHYSTAGALNFNAFTNPIAVERFAAPGAPIAGWGGVKVRF
jgi:outer membrane receptor protein involved in Fe transport